MTVPEAISALADLGAKKTRFLEDRLIDRDICAVSFCTPDGTYCRYTADGILADCLDGLVAWAEAKLAT